MLRFARILELFLPPRGRGRFPLTGRNFGLYSGVAGFWLEGARDSEKAEVLSPRRSLLLPLEFVVPAFVIVLDTSVEACYLAREK